MSGGNNGFSAPGKRASVLIVAGYADSIIRFRGDLIRAMKLLGLEVHAAAPGLSKNVAFCHWAKKEGVIVHELGLNRTGMNPVQDLATFVALLTLLRRISPDCFLGYSIKPVIFGSIAARLRRVPRVYALITGVGYALTGGTGTVREKLLSGLVVRLYQFALRCVDLVFFQNPDDRNLFVDQGIISSGAVTCVIHGSGVDVEHFAATPVAASPHFLMIARLLKQKGVREFVEAARRIKAESPKSIFTLVGWLEDHPDSIEEAELDGWVDSGIIEFTGYLEDVRSAIKECSVFVLPSYREGTPRSVLEAMSMGRAVITTDVPGCRETVRDGENGFLVSSQSPDHLSEAMAKFIDSPLLAKKMGERSREIAEQKYDVHRVNRVMLEQMGLFHDSNTQRT